MRPITDYVSFHLGWLLIPTAPLGSWILDPCQERWVVLVMGMPDFAAALIVRTLRTVLASFPTSLSAETKKWVTW
jgi:hypothetical protein